MGQIIKVWSQINAIANGFLRKNSHLKPHIMSALRVLTMNMHGQALFGSKFKIFAHKLLTSKTIRSCMPASVEISWILMLIITVLSLSGSASAASKAYEIGFEGNFNTNEGLTPLIAEKINFTTGRFGQAAVIGNDSQLAYLLDENYDPVHGTIEMWIRPNWNSSEIFDNKVFWVLAGDVGKNNRAVLGVYKYGEERYLYFANIKDFEDIHSQATGFNMIHSPITWAAEQWHHILVCWDEDLRYRALYVDGEFKDATRYTQNMPRSPEALYLGYMPGRVKDIVDGYHADIAIDDFKLCKTVKGNDFYRFAHD